MGRPFLFICILLYVLTALNDTVLADPIASLPGQKEPPFIIADLRYEIAKNYTNVVIGTNERVDFVYYTFKDPYRVIIDLIGVVFCELEERIEIEEGPIKSISIIKDDTAAKPEGLDRYFYAADYIIIELREDYPFQTFCSKDGKVIVAQIKAKTQPEVTKEAEIVTRGPEEIPPPPKQILPQPIIIEDLEYEVNPQSSIVAVVSSKNLKATVYEEYNPYKIVIDPAEGVFCELEEKMEPMEGLVKSISITKDIPPAGFKAPDKFFYPVKSIVIEPIVQLPFAVHAADNGSITVVRIEKGKELPPIEEEVEVIKLPKEAEVIEQAKEIKVAEAAKEIEEEAARIEVVPPKPPPTKKLTLDEERIAEEVAEKLYKKQEQLFAKREEEEQRKRAIREARDKAKAIRAVEKIGVEELEDLMVKGEGVAVLKYCQDIALSYSEPVVIAEEEIKLSETKLKENFRALFPSVKIKGTRTSGDVMGTDFIEKIYGVEAEYPLYEGGKLWNAYRQSQTNMQLAKGRYNKIVHDLDYKVAEAYYSTVTSVMNLRLQQELLKKAEAILNTASKRHSSGLSTDLEFFNVKSQYNQAQFQLASAERDLALARFKLEQAMSMDIAEEKIDVGEVETELKFEIIDIELKKCLELAQEYHPDIVVNELLVASNEYEEKIAKGKDKLRIDLTGFFGRSGSYYKTEPDKMYKDWNVGVKVSKPIWGGNTATYSFAKEETKRKVGQTDRQSTETHSGEFAILNAMGVVSGIQEAQIKRHKAENELLETRRHVNLEVKEAYYNYQEAIIQVKNALEKVRFQKEAVKTAKAQGELNEALQSQLLEAEIKLADERSLYIKALSDYNFSLAKLNRAIGIEDYFSID